MKTKSFKVIISIICLVCLAVFVGTAAACGEEPIELEYTSSTLVTAQVGKAYTASVATATGAEKITYAEKSSTPLPSGLVLSPDGVISGTPTAATEVEVTIIASAEGADSIEAEFTIVVKPVELDESEGLVMEAEYADLTDAKYAAVSYAPIVFYESESASNGRYLADLGNKGNTIRFKFEAVAADTEATLFVTMKSIPALPFACEPAVMRISINGVDKKYKKTTLPAAFTTFEIPISIDAGENTIEFITTDNQIMQENNIPVMPNFDCIRVKSATKLSWTPKLDNHL